MKKILAGCSAGVVLLAGVPAAHATSVAVRVRVEGPTSTLFEAPVSTDVRTFAFTGDATAHECDGTASTGGTSATPVPVRNGALLTGLEAAGIAVHGTWYSFGPSFTDIGGTNVDYDPATNKYLVEYLNGTAASTGGCSDPITAGDDVVYAYGTGSENVLKLTGPATVAPGATAGVKVTDEATGAAISGATVGGQTTDAAGSATVGPFSTRGPQPALKATKDGSIRSNALPVCVTDGADGFCGTTAPGATTTTATTSTPPPVGPPAPAHTEAKIGGIADHQHFDAGKAPRTLGGLVTVGAPGLKDVAIRLTRNDRGRCAAYDGKHERFVAMRRCGAARGSYFSVGSAASWSYLLPGDLARGRYVLDVMATDKAGNADALARGRNRIVFFVG